MSNDPNEPPEPDWPPSYTDVGPADNEEVATETPAQPPGYLWLLYLFFRPGVFFRHFVLDPSPGLTALCAWVYGMSAVIDRIELQTARGREFPAADDWAGYWAVVVVAGILSGVIYFVFGGWWYRVRLRWSGAASPNKALARRVYLYASQVVALPALAATTADTAHFASPAAAFEGEMKWWQWIPLVCLFWGCWTSYAGARAAFVLRRGRALAWFAILPAVFYVLLFGGVSAAAIWAMLRGPADIDSPQTHHSVTMHFEYPGNWMIDDYAETYDANADLYVEPIHDAWFHVMLYAPHLPPEQELEASRRDLAHVLGDLHITGRFSRWGMFEGTGCAYSGSVKGETYRLRLFVTRVSGSKYLEIQELCRQSQLAKVQPGFDLIEHSFRLSRR